MLYALGFIGLFTIGGLTGLFLASLAIDVHVHDTYFVVAHFHYIMVGGTVMAYLGGIHFWWPKMTGRMYPEIWGKLSALTVFVGFNLTFFPQFVLGYLGMPRRYHEYPPEFQVLNVMSTAGRVDPGRRLPAAAGLPVLSLALGRRPGPNPWGRPGLEWQTASPPPTDNFEETPVVTDGPYDTRPRRRRTPMRPSTIASTDADARADPRWRTSSTTWSSSTTPRPRDVDLPGHRGDVLRRPVRGLRRLPVLYAARVRRGQPAAQRSGWAASTPSSCSPAA